MDGTKQIYIPDVCKEINKGIFFYWAFFYCIFNFVRPKNVLAVYIKDAHRYMSG